jgi:ATP-dependent Lon protease
VKGMNRVRLVEELADEPYLVAKVMEITEDDYSGDEVEALTKRLVEQFRKAINMGKGVEITTIMRILSNQTDAVEIVDSVAGLLDMKTADKQELLETFSVKERLNKVLDLITHEISVLDLERMISAKTQKRFEDQMKKAMLREKKRTIEQELGEEDDPDASDDIKEYKGKIKKAKMPELVLEKALKREETRAHVPHNPETGYIRNYLDWDLTCHGTTQVKQQFLSCK